MADKHVPTIAGASFEDLKKTNDYEAEYWSARDLQSLLGYGQWRRFEETIKRAIISCEQSGNNPSHHFAGAGKMIELGSGSVREDVLRGMMVREPPQILCLDTAFHGNDPLKTNAVLEAQSHGITFRTV